MIVVVCCLVLGARCLSFCLFVVRSWLFGVRCLLFVVSGFLCVVSHLWLCVFDRGVLRVVFWVVVCCLLFVVFFCVVRCLLCVVC